MGNPIWQVQSLDLGTIAENIYFEYELLAIDTDAGPITYSVVAGEMPDGISLVGSIISGIPVDVAIDTVSKFSIRATTTTSVVSDVTFVLTVSGQQPPEIISPITGNVGQYYYGSYVNVELTAEDADLTDELTWEVMVGDLPAGLELIANPNNDRIAYIRGYAYPITLLGIDPPIGFDYSPYDRYDFDFNLSAIDKNYQFSISVSDGIDYDVKEYTIFLLSKDSLTADNCTTTHYSCNHYANPSSADNDLFIFADNTSLTADNCTTNHLECTQYANPLTVDDTTNTVDQIDLTADNCSANTVECGTAPNVYTNPMSADRMWPTVDITPQRNPIILNTNTDLGTVLHDNYYAHLVQGQDFDNNQLEYREWLGNNIITQFPPNLQIDPTTGWIYGYLAPMGAIEKIYKFSIVAYKLNEPDITSIPLEFTMTVVGDIANVITWITPTIMYIDNGKISELAIEATNTLGVDLTYSMVSGDIPESMELTTTGLIIGRPKFGDNTDNSYTFVINVQDRSGKTVNINKEFTIIVNQVNDEPYEALYLVAKPTISERIYLESYTSNTEIYDPALVYRAEDPYFAISDDLRFLLVDGLTPKPISDYADAMEFNHYTRSFRYSNLKVARALNSDKSVRYEVIYAEIIDPLENNDKESINQSIILDGVESDEVIRHNKTPTVDEYGNIVIYPASLKNMRNQIITNITQTTKDTLPTWMTSSQENGRSLGFIPAVILAYAKPGLGNQLLYNIENSNFDITTVEFEVDRYVWDTNMTTDPDPVTTGNYFHYSEPIDPDLDGNLPTEHDDYENIVGFDMDPFSARVGFEGPDVEDKFIKFPQDGVFK